MNHIVMSSTAHNLSGKELIQQFSKFSKNDDHDDDDLNNELNLNHENDHILMQNTLVSN
jgi:hypothetical protein